MMQLLDQHRRSLLPLLLGSALVLTPWEWQHRPYGVLGQEVYDDTYCNVFNDVPLLMLDRLNACDDVVSPKCQCGMQEEDFDTYASCWDQKVQCSTMNPSVCGRQSAMTTILGNRNVYVWEYTSGRNEKLTWTYDADPNTCTFEIEASSGSKTYCTCELTDCNRAPRGLFQLPERRHCHRLLRRTGNCHGQCAGGIGRDSWWTVRRGHSRALRICPSSRTFRVRSSSRAL